MELNTLQAAPEKFFDVPDTDIKVKIRLPFRNELGADFKACQTKDGNLVDAKWYRIVATKYLLDVKGITENGKDCEYTAEIGMLLMKDQRFGTFIDKMLFATSEWLDEGKDVGGTD